VGNKFAFLEEGGIAVINVLLGAPTTEVAVGIVLGSLYTDVADLAAKTNMIKAKLLPGFIQE
jgi:hypothetical protein